MVYIRLGKKMIFTKICFHPTSIVMICMNFVSWSPNKMLWPHFVRVQNYKCTKVQKVYNCNNFLRITLNSMLQIEKYSRTEQGKAMYMKRIFLWTLLFISLHVTGWGAGVLPCRNPGPDPEVPVGPLWEAAHVPRGQGLDYILIRVGRK